MAIRPAALIQALLVLVVGFVALGLFKRWLQNSYLPTTNLDTGMQVSFITLFGYIGGVLAVALALSAAGIGLERIAWVASALSVGIGFGLQAVVQNFVSGLILLAERPVKVGDWVSLGGVEGDIRRINVRATEIQLGDRSTVIVPNSEFITKTVRNVTLANPLGLVQVKLPLPLGTDAQAARALILSTFVDNPDVLDAGAQRAARRYRQWPVAVQRHRLCLVAAPDVGHPQCPAVRTAQAPGRGASRLPSQHDGAEQRAGAARTPAILAVAPAPAPVPPLTS